MKTKLLSIIVLLASVSGMMAQAPQMFNYQAIARDASGNAIANKQIGVRFTMHNLTASGEVVYQETQLLSTNQFGLFTAAVGSGSNTKAGNGFENINWGAGAKYLQVETDMEGGNSYSDMGEAQLLSVPYALYAANGGGDDTKAAVPGPTGPTGPKGATGATGAAGAAGSKGATGPTGAQGTAGAAGAKGATGTAGANGANGAVGLKGATGATGTAGANGATGATGPQGIPGATGPQGANGFNGNNGNNGLNGAQGVAGSTGSTGPQGGAGVQGATGKQGATGAQGPAGSNGATGTQGAQGAQGATGPQGPTGADGALNAWGLQGSAGTNPATNFIGTTDNEDLVFKVNGQTSGLLDNVGGTTILGVLSGGANPGPANSFFGYQAGQNSTGGSNTAVGIYSMYGNTYGTDNTASGISSLLNNATGSYNTGMGFWALATNQSGNSNTAIGALADATVDGLTNATAIGANAQVSASNSLVLGNNANVGIGTSAPGAKLDVEGNIKITDGTQASGYVLTSDANGLASWQTLPPSGWGLSGNAGTTAGTNFIGTTDANAMDVRTNNVIKVRFTTQGAIETYNTGQSVFIGQGAGANDNLANNANVFIGYQSGNANISGGNNTATGYQALTSNNSGSFNTATGGSALSFNTSGGFNTANGVGALSRNVSGNANTATGADALSNNTNSYNTADGYQALLSNTGGTQNVGIGGSALESNISGSYNTATGYQALYQSTGDQNTAVGVVSLSSNTSGFFNTALGAHALSANTGGNTNTGIGFNANVASGNLSNATAIGANATVSVSNALVLGSGANVGIGLSNPTSPLDVMNFGGGFAMFIQQPGASGSGLVICAGQNTFVGGVVPSHILFALPNQITIAGIVQNSSSSVLYATTSDIRLKENIQPTKYGLNALMNVQVRDYNYKGEDAGQIQTGFLAQQLYQVFPGAVKKGGDDQKTDPWMVDYGRVTPMLVQSIQDQQKIIDTLKNEVESLKNEVESLKTNR